MSLRGFDEPTNGLRTCFSDKVRSNSESATEVSVGCGIAVITTRPQLPTRLIAFAT
ncbi:hypothetical protein ACNUDN_01740 [Mycobacterium sp. smrl_JER01]